MARASFPNVSNRTGWFNRRRGAVLLGLLILVNVGVNFWWTQRDRSLMPVGDSYIYMTKVLYFIDGVADGTLDSFSSAIRALSFGGRPPVYQLLTVPFVLVFGRTESAALMVNGLFIVLLMFCTYRIGSMLRNPATGVLSAFLVSCYPPVVNLSRLYLPYVALPAVAALVLWLLLRLVRDRSVPVAWGFGASLGLGLLMHPNFLWFAAPTSLVVGLYLVLFHDGDPLPKGVRDLPAWLVRRVGDRFVLRGLGPGAVIALAVSVPWYLTYGRYLLGLLKRVSSSESVAIRGMEVRSFGFPDVDPGFWWYLATAPGVLSWFFVVLGLVACVAAVVVGDRLGRTLAAAVVVTYLVLASGKIMVWWYPPMVLPALAALTSWWIVGFKRRRLSAALVVLCIGVAGFNYAVVTWGVEPRFEGLARILGAPLKSGTCATRFNVAFCPAPSQPQSAAWPVSDIIEVIQNDARCGGETCRLMVTKVGDLSLARFTYLAARDWPGLRLNITGEAARVWGKPYNLGSLIKSDYILFPDGWIPRNAGMYKSATIRLLQSPPPLFALAHREVATFEGPGGRAVTLLGRVEELTVHEAVETIGALDLKERFKSERYEVLSSLYVAERDLEGMEALFDEVSRKRVNEKTVEMIGRRLERLKEAAKRSKAGSIRASKPMEPASPPGGSIVLPTVVRPDADEATGDPE